MKRILSLLLSLTMIISVFVVIPTTVEATEDYRAWAQRDSRWSSIRLGSSSYTIGSDGCLVSSITKLIIQAGFRNADSFNIGTLANWLNSNGGYTTGGLLYWAKPSACISGFNYYGNLLDYGTYNSSSYNSQLISWVNSGYHITLQVSGGSHWVAIDEAKTKAKGEIYIMDSSDGVNADLTLSSRYGTFNKAVAYTGGSSPNPTPAASVNKGSEGYYTIGEKTTISVDAPNMQSAVLKIYHTPENGSTYLYWEGEIFSSQYTTSFSKKGHYSCVFFVNYGNYQTESNWVGWNIIEKPVVSIDKGQNGKYVFGEQVNFSLDVSGFDAYVLIIYRTPTNGETYEYWEGEVYGPKYTMNFYNEGYYSCCFGLWKNGYYTESGWIGWSVVEKATASVNKGPDGHYATGEQVNFSLDVTGYDAYVLVIYRTPTNGETYEYWEGEVNGPDYTMTFYNEGYYSCCFCLWKNDCYFESAWVGWIVNNSIEPTNPPTEPSIIKLGDVDGDGEVTIIDATCIQRKLASIATAKFVEAASDADEDGELTIIDATVIQRWLVQLPSNDNIGKPINK